jgi:gliding motility-associated-like protein
MFTSNPNFYTTIALPKFQFFNQSRIADSSILRYNWNFGTGTGLDTSTQRDPAFSYGKDTNTYEVRLIAISDKGCRDTAYRMLKVGPDIIVYIPNAFTPDDAGPNGNNTFKVYIENFTSYKMHVFNRWGEKMFESTDVNQGWNGRANGQDCQQDVYAYLVEVTSFEGKLYKFTGTITLLR